jgi:hypothetical protein
MSSNFMCGEFIGHIQYINDATLMPESSLDITDLYIRRPRFFEYYLMFSTKLLMLFEHGEWNTIQQTPDGRYWVIFKTPEDAVMFKLTHL